MVERREGHVYSVRTISNYSDNFAMLKIEIDFDEYYIFYDPAQLTQFVDKDVYYTTRPDVVNEKKVEVVCEIALVTEVVTLDKVSNDVKLIPFDVKRPVCNFNIREVKFGEYKVGCIAILTGMDKGESRKATWLDCHLIDAYGHMFDLRMFTDLSNVTDVSKFSGMINGYVEFDLESTKYGYQTTSIQSLPQDIEKSPEIAIARSVVMDYINSDPVINNLVASTGLVTVLDNYVDTEPGYLWVRIASELYLIDTFDNITSGMNITTMKRATIATRLFALPHSGEWSNTIVNVVKMLKFSEISKDNDLRSIVDVFYKGDTSETRIFYFKIRDMVDSIIRLRRGFNYGKETYNRIIDECHLAFNGLL